MKNQTALITGASSGIGKQLAHQFAKNDYSIIGIADKEDELEVVANELRSEYEVDVETIAADLAEEDAPEQVLDQLQDKEIEILVNNAGVGERGKFHEIDLEAALKILRTNVEAILRLTRPLLRQMVSRGGGKILNTGSVAGFQPGPLMSVYHASKAFVVSFSEAIHEEVKDSGVTVTVLCPGPTDTNWFDRAEAEGSWITSLDSMMMEPKDVAEAGYEALMEGDDVIIPGYQNKALTFTRRIIPKSLQATANKQLWEVEEDDSLL